MCSHDLVSTCRRFSGLNHRKWIHQRRQGKIMDLNAFTDSLWKVCELFTTSESSSGGGGLWTREI
jgi:hypothetical protein